MALDGTSGEVPGKRKRVVVSGNSGDDEGSHCHHQDRISDLPECLLLQILMLLPLVEAVRTSALSRRWRSAWTRLPRLAFDDDDAAAHRLSRFGDLVDGVLHGYSHDFDMPYVSISVRRRTSPSDAARLATSAARLAAGRAAAGFHLCFHDVDEAGDDEEEVAETLDLPCFARATELALTFMGVELRMPSTGTFAKLTKLFISSVRFADGGEGISTVVSLRCPCLESLELRRIHGVRVLSFLAQRSPLLCLRLSLVMQLERLLVLTESLLEMQVQRCFLLSNAPISMLLNVPVLEKLHWEDRYPHGDDGFSLCNLPSSLQKLVVVEVAYGYLLHAGGPSHFTKMLQSFRRADTLRLEIPIAPDHAELNDLIDNVKLPHHSELELIVNKNQHKFGPSVVNLLKKTNCVRKLTLQVYHGEIAYAPCMSNCNCRQPSNWRRQNIPLHSLKWVVMNGFSGTRDEQSLLYSIMKNAKGLNKVSIASYTGVNPTEKFLRKLRGVSTAGCTMDY